MKIPIRIIIEFWQWLKSKFNEDKRPTAYPQLNVNPYWKLPPKPNPAKKANLKFEGETKVPRPMRRKAKKELPFSHQAKQKIRV